MKMLTSILLLLFISTHAFAQKTKEFPDSKVDFDSFMKVSKKVQKYRKGRMLGLDEFLKNSQEEGVIILDTRSEAAYKRKHIKGAIHLNFSDFTEEKLAKLIPDKETKILIYCNNNIDGDNINFAAKSQPLALNIPTFINLYGYGYENIYELADLVSIDNQKLEFEGTDTE